MPTLAERRAAMTWAQRLKRVFGIDIETCSACGGAVRIIACIEDAEVIETILTHLDAKAAEPEATRRPAWWPARDEMHVSEAIVGRVQGLTCRAGPLLRSDRRPTWGVDGRAERLLLDEKAVYIDYTPISGEKGLPRCSSRPAHGLMRTSLPEIDWKIAAAAATLAPGKPNVECRLRGWYNRAIRRGSSVFGTNIV